MGKKHHVLCVYTMADAIAVGNVFDAKEGDILNDYVYPIAPNTYICSYDASDRTHKEILEFVKNIGHSEL